MTETHTILGGKVHVYRRPRSSHWQCKIKSFAKKIIGLFIKPIKIGKISVHTSVSMGISIYPNDSKRASQLLHYSDVALYEAKKSGGNQYWFYGKGHHRKSK